MTAHLRIDTSEQREAGSERLLILHCTLLTGKVRKGDELDFVINPAFSITLPVDELEEKPEQNQLTIHIRCEDESDFEFMAQLDLEGEVLEVLQSP